MLDDIVAVTRAVPEASSIWVEPLIISMGAKATAHATFMLKVSVASLRHPKSDAKLHTDCTCFCNQLQPATNLISIYEIRIQVLSEFV